MLHKHCARNNNDHKKKLGEPTICASLDLREAFDSVERGLLSKQ